MKFKILSLVALVAIGLFSCNTSNKKGVTDVDTLKVEENIYPSTKTFYKSDLNGENSILFAESIIYDVILLPKEGDEWEEYRTKNVDAKAFENVIFHAIYNGRLTPYHYRDEEFFGDANIGKVVSIDEVKAFEKEYGKNPLAQIQFKEDWYFNEETLEMSKKIKSIIFGYKVMDGSDFVKYKALFKVHLNQTEKNDTINTK